MNHETHVHIYLSVGQRNFPFLHEDCFLAHDADGLQSHVAVHVGQLFPGEIGDEFESLGGKAFPVDEEGESDERGVGDEFQLLTLPGGEAKDDLRLGAGR